MAWRREPGGNSWKRPPKDWMEEDDLLDSEFSREEDLRSKLQRAPGEHTEQDQQDMGHHRQGSFTGNKIPRRGGFWRGRGNFVPARGGFGGFRSVDRNETGGRGSKNQENRDREQGSQPCSERGRPSGFGVGMQQGRDSKIQEGLVKEIRCFRCSQSGHHQADCPNDPLCYKCKESGHMAAECQNNKKLRLFGFGIPEQGFFGFDIPEKKVQVNMLNAVIHILEGEPTEEKLDRELKNLVQANWDFRVRRMDKHDFSASFPDKSSLESYAKLSSLELPLYSYRVQVTKANSDLMASSVLQCVWIKIYNLPDIAREEGIIREVASLVGKPVVVDELSIIKEGPVRVKVDCRDPSRIKGFIEVFFNKVGYELKVVAEGARTRSPYLSGPSGSGKQDDKDQDKDRNRPGRDDEKKGGKFERKREGVRENSRFWFWRISGGHGGRCWGGGDTARDL
jgi:hypothetical protein